MEVQEVFDQLVQARVSHLRWLETIEAWARGMQIHPDKLGLIPTDTAFGRWYHGTGRVMRHLPSYQRMSIPHQKIHHIAKDIAELLQEDEKQGVLQWLGIQANRDDERRLKVKALLPQLKEASQELLDDLDKLEEEFRLDRAKHQMKNRKHSHDPIRQLDALSKDLRDMGYHDD